MEKNTLLDLLNAIDLFASLNESEKKALAAISRHQHFQKGETLFTKGEVSRSVMILTDGVVHIFKHDGKGNEITIGSFHRYALLAEAATLRRSPLPSSATFKTDGSILKISLDGFERFLKQHPLFAYKVIQSLLEKIDLLQQNIHFGLASSSKEKILNFYSRNPRIAMELRQYEVASILGMTPETLSRGIRQLVREKQLLKKATGYAVIDDTE